ncbi:class I lanthipeptide [Taibaiella koreensis]|uniref:class I lanthipeptide n=1 Tax=Taibaiella koreensis TaxID=1268548 RepID=UPI000E59C6B5|nr:class I lanthipeptide [Taibaiella koreensis]
MKKKTAKKLMLSKSTISPLQPDAQKAVQGGESFLGIACITNGACHTRTPICIGVLSVVVCITTITQGG